MLINNSKTLCCLFFTFLVSACGGGSDKATTTPPPIVSNTAPQLSEYSDRYLITENNTIIVEGITASDADSDALSVSFSGEDADLFTFDMISGELAFKSAPDYETLLDSDQDGIYNVELNLSDGQLSVTASIEVKVVNDLSIEIISPVNNSNIGGESTYAVVAKINDPESGDLSYLSKEQVQINGNAATAIDSNFEYWMFTLGNPALDDITAEITFDGMTSTDSISVMGLQPFVSVQDIAVNEDKGVLYLNDEGTRTITEVALDGSSSTIFYTPSKYGFDSASSILFDSTDNRLIATLNVPKSDNSIWFIETVIAIDLTTKEHTIISGELVGSGDLLSTNTGQLTFYNDFLLLPDYNNQSIVKIDLETGNRTTLSSDILGSGPSILRPNGMAVDSANNKAYVSSESKIIEVDLLTGNRTIIGDDDVGTGTDLVYPDHFFFDGDNNRLVFSNETEGITTLNLDTKIRTVLPTPSLQSTLVLGAEQRFYTFDYWNNAIISGVLGEESFDTVITIKTGQGNQINDPYSAVFSEESQSLFFNDFGVFSFDLAEQSVASLSGEGADISNGFGIAINTDTNNLIAINNAEQSETSLLSINTINGNREVITAFDSESDVNFNNPIDLVLDNTNSYAFILDAPNYKNNNAAVNIIQVELATGIKKLVSNNANNSGIDFTNPNSITYQPIDNTLLVIQNKIDETGVDIINVDIATGERSLVSSNIDENILSGVNDSLILDDGSFVIMSWRSIYKVDLLTGESDIISSNDHGNGIPFAQIQTVTYDPENNRLFVIDMELKGIFAVDISTGNRSLLVSGN